MFKNANLYINELNELKERCMFNDKYKFVAGVDGCLNINLNNENKNYYDSNLSLVWINDKNEITGYLTIDKNFICKTFYIDFAVSFIDNNYEFINGIYKLVKKQFIDNPNMNKLQFGGCTANPAVEKYRKIANKLKKKDYLVFENYYYNSMYSYDGQIYTQMNFQIFKPGTEIK